MLRDGMVMYFVQSQTMKSEPSRISDVGGGVVLAAAARTEDHSSQSENCNCSSVPMISIYPNQFIGALSSGVLFKRSSENRKVRRDSCVRSISR